jgi:hypothetical protein
MIDENGSITKLRKTHVEILKELDKIYKSRHNYHREFGKYPTLLIINEIDYMFFKEYFSHNQHRVTGFQEMKLLNMTVLKMKAKGFVFAYE